MRGLCLIAFLACGSVLSGPLFLAAALGVLPFMIAAVRLADPHRASWGELGVRHQLALLVLAAATALMTSSLLVAIPSLYDRAAGWAIRPRASNAKS